MTYEATRVVPAGWYEDPASSAHVRWWNGLAWTEHTTLKPTAPPRPQPVAEQRYGDGFTRQQNQQGWLTDQGQGQHGQHSSGQQYDQGHAVGAAAGAAGTGTEAAGSGAIDPATGHTPDYDAGYAASTAARIAEARELERQYGISTAEHDIIVRSATEGSTQDAGHGQVSAEYASTWQTAPDDDDFEEPRTATASSWFMALYPILTLVAAIAAGYVYFYVSPDPAIAGIPIIAGLVLVPYLLCIVWAISDARRLKAFGHDPASPAFAIAGPLVYLIARRVRVKGAGPLVLLIVLTLAAVALPAAAVSSGTTAPVTKALEIQQEVRAHYLDTGELASVSCPIFVESLAQGALYTCDGTLADGSPKTVWVSIDDAAGHFSYSLALK